MPKYIVIHEHDHGTTSYLVEYEKEPTISQLVRCLDLDFEPSKGESLTIGVVNEDEPTILDWQDSDAEEFDEFDAGDEDEEVKYLNHYRCAHEDQSRSGYGKPADEWTMVWSCMCNDKCPTCNAEIEPYKSDELPAT